MWTDWGAKMVSRVVVSPTCLQIMLTECLFWRPFSKTESTMVIQIIRKGTRSHNSCELMKAIQMAASSLPCTQCTGYTLQRVYTEVERTAIEETISTNHCDSWELLFLTFPGALQVLGGCSMPAACATCARLLVSDINVTKTNLQVLSLTQETFSQRESRYRVAMARILPN